MEGWQRLIQAIPFESAVTMSGQDLITRFESSGKIRGKYQKAVSIGAVFRVKKDEKTELGPSVATIRPIDAVCHAEDGSFWLIMAQGTLDYAVLGQLLLFDYLYREEHTHDKPPRKALVCDKISEQVVWLCSRLGIDVFEVTEAGAARVEAKLLQ